MITMDEFTESLLNKTYVFTKETDANGDIKYTIDDEIAKNGIEGVRSFMSDVDLEDCDYLDDKLEELSVEVVDKINDDFSKFFINSIGHKCSAELLIDSASENDVTDTVYNMFIYEENMLNFDKKFYFEFQNMSADEQRSWYLQSFGISNKEFTCYKSLKNK